MDGILILGSAKPHKGLQETTCASRSITMKSLFSRFVKDESGATAIEYGLIAALIGIAVMAAVGSVGTNLDLKFKNIANALQ